MTKKTRRAADKVAVALDKMIRRFEAEVENARADADHRAEVARRFYSADGSYILAGSVGEAIEMRIAAAARIESLEAEVDETRAEANHHARLAAARLDALDDLRAERDDLANFKATLEGAEGFCPYCEGAWGPLTAEGAAAHAATCPDHPMRAVEAERDRALDMIEHMKIEIGGLKDERDALETRAATLEYERAAAASKLDTAWRASDAAIEAVGELRAEVGRCNAEIDRMADDAETLRERLARADEENEALNVEVAKLASACEYLSRPRKTA